MAATETDWLTGEALPDAVQEVEKYLLQIGKIVSPEN